MPVRYRSDPELARLSTWPGEIIDEDALTFFTLAEDDQAWLRGFNRNENGLGVAERIVRPPVDALTRRIATARDGARGGRVGRRGAGRRGTRSARLRAAGPGASVVGAQPGGGVGHGGRRRARRVGAHRRGPGRSGCLDSSPAVLDG